MTKSLAAVAVAPGKTELREFPLPKIGSNEGLMKVESVGICGTDWHLYQTDTTNYPIILGHECVGRVAEIGKEAAERWNVREGDRIVIEEPLPCGNCWICRTVNYQMCKKNGRYGHVPITVAPSLWGGFSQYMYLHPNSVVYKISEDIPAEEAPLFIPISNGIRWVQQKGGLGIGDTVVVQGPGQHGLGCVIAAKEAGAGCIIVTGLSKDAKRLELARELGAHCTINVEEENVVEKIQELTDGKMADLVLDVTSGAPRAVTTALDLARLGGTIIIAGANYKAIPDFMSDKIFKKELTIKGVYGRDFQAVIPAIKLLESRKHPFHKLSTHVFSLEDTDLALRTFGGKEKTDKDPIHISLMPN